MKPNGKVGPEKEGGNTSGGICNKGFCLEDGSDIVYEPWRHRSQDKALGTPGALFHMIKGSLGAGILSMPIAFKNGGLWTSLVCAILVGLICTHCVHIIVYCSQYLSVKVKKPSLGYAATAEAAFATSSNPSLRKYAAFVREFVDISLMITYYFGVTVYVVFIASTLEQIVEDNSSLDLNTRYYILMISVLVVPVGSIRYLKYLVPFSFLAIVFLLFGVGFVMFEVLKELPPVDSRPAFSNIRSLPLFYATVLYALEGIGTVFPIENAMRRPQAFLGPPYVLNISMALLIFLYAMVGFFGYLRYGDETQGSVTLNLNSSVIAQVVKVLVAFNVLFSYGLCFCVPVEAMWRKLEPKVQEKNQTSAYYTMRILLIFGCVAIACALPDLEPFVGLCGAICYSTLGLLFPAVVDLVTFWDDKEYMGPFRWKLYKNIFLIFMWLVALTAGTEASVAKIIEIYV